MTNVHIPQSFEVPGEAPAPKPQLAQLISSCWAYRYWLLGGWFVFLLSSCSVGHKVVSAGSSLNTAHLDHLYQEVPLADTSLGPLGAIWIYCEAPDYRLVGDEDEGFTCVDDVARALVFYGRHYRQYPSAAVLRKINTLSAFLLYMQADNGYFHNFMLPDGQINTTHVNSVAKPNWWSWRALWALSELNLIESAELKSLQARSQGAIDKLLKNMGTLCPNPLDRSSFEGLSLPSCLADLGADQVALIMIGLTNVYSLHPSASVKQQLIFWGDLLRQAQFGDVDSPPYYAFLSWRNYWHAWGNSQAYALLYAGRILQQQTFIEAGLREVRHFYPYCIAQGFLHEFQVVSSADSLLLKDVAPFSQIAYDIRPMVFAALEAYTITGDESFIRTAQQLTAWLSGANPAQQAMYDPATGRTFDGISSATQVNYNSGAESTIEALLSLQALSKFPPTKRNR